MDILRFPLLRVRDNDQAGVNIDVAFLHVSHLSRSDLDVGRQQFNPEPDFRIQVEGDPLDLLNDIRLGADTDHIPVTQLKFNLREIRHFNCVPPSPLFPADNPRPKIVYTAF